MPILFKTQVNRAVNTRLPRCHARVGGLCGFQDTVERVPHRKPEDRTLRRRVGALAENARIGKNGSGESCLRQTWNTPKWAEPGNFRRRDEKAGESQGVVRAPWRTHLPAVRAVWGFHAGVVERAKIAPLGSEAQIITLFQGKQRGSNEKYGVKAKFALWITPECKQHVLLLR